MAMISVKHGALDQYLRVATFNNVVAERAVATDRWRLYCKGCEKTLTFAESYDISQAYSEDGRLDAGIQQFAKDHRHLEPSHMNKFGNIVYEPDTAVQKIPTLSQNEAFVPIDTGEMLKKSKELDAAKVKNNELMQKVRELKNKVPAPLLEKKTEGRKFR